MLSPNGRRSRGSGSCSPTVGVTEHGGEGSDWCLRGFGIAREAVKDGSIVENRSGTLLRKPTQPDEGSGCYPRVRRGHRQVLTFGGKYGTRAQLLCWIASDHKRAGSGPWLARDRRRPEQVASLVIRRGGERQGGTDRCASTVLKETGTEVLRENRSRWKGALAELLCCVGRGPERGRYLVGSVRNAGTERTWFVCNAAGLGQGECQAKTHGLLLLPVGGFASLGCTVAEARDTNWAGGGRSRGSLGGGTGTYFSVCRPRNQYPR